jgi:hypothetical protein
MRNLKALYDPEHPFNENLDDGHASLDNLQKQFDLMQRAQDNANGSIDPAI